MFYARLAALALAATSLAAIGCGGSSKVGSTNASQATASTTSSATSVASTTGTVKAASGTSLGYSQWIAKGDAICARLNAQLTASPVKAIQEFARALPQAAAYERIEYAQLAKLVPPPSKAADWQQFLTDTRLWAEDSAKLGEIAQAHKFSIGMQLVSKSRSLHEQLAKIAKQDGFKTCSIT